MSMTLFGFVNSWTSCTKMGKATIFIASCYGINNVTSNMSDIRIKLWCQKKRSRSRSIVLSSLPPTTECFEENVLRAELQAHIWRSAMNPGPPDLDVTKLGWIKDDETQSLTPVYSSVTRPFIPAKLENLLACSCSGDGPCKSLQCGCHRNHMRCSMFCNCHYTECQSPRAQLRKPYIVPLMMWNQTMIVMLEELSQTQMSSCNNVRVIVACLIFNYRLSVAIWGPDNYIKHLEIHDSTSDPSV